MVTVDRVWQPDIALTRAVEGLFGRAIASYLANPNLISEHANQEESIRVGGYANRTLLELVQNAADAMAGGQDTSGRVEIVLDPEREILYCANSGRPFSKSGLTAISHAHLSGKRGDEIGRFGLGFKSVLAVSDSPQVFSRSVSFEFNSLEARAELVRIEPTAKRYPTLRTATAVDPLAAFVADPVLADLATWASTIVKLPGVSDIERFRREIEGFSSEFLLFVSAVRQVKLRVLGDGGLDASHTSRDLGNDVFRIEGRDGGSDEWIVRNRMHAPSPEARQQVGEAVSRAEVKVTVAMPTRHARQRTGRFWSYFPLQDETSASALFNAPWSVNDDRTTLLRNDYNREVLRTLSQMFAEMLGRVSTPGDPAAHLDYMPARGRETLSFGDELLCAHVPRICAGLEVIPNARGTLGRSTELRPLDFAVTVEETAHRAWIESPNTGDDVPHWRCYSSPQRVSRLRQAFVAGLARDSMEVDDRDSKRALEALPKRGLNSWLREWADGADVVSARDAVRFVLGHRGWQGIEQARVVPTTDGLCRLSERAVVFLHREEDVEIENARFVAPAFLALPGAEELLRQAGFRDLDPLAVLKARFARLSPSSTGDEFQRFWDAVVGVSVADALKELSGRPVRVKVPTGNGGWRWPNLVFDLGEHLGDRFAPITLDHSRCMPEVAHKLGVVREPVAGYQVEDEPRYDEYRQWVLAVVNERLGPGERPVENVELHPGKGPGPFSVLHMLREAGASPEVRERWTVKLLETGDAEWGCEDLDTGRNFPVRSPVSWAVEHAGILNSNRGFRAPGEVVAPSLLKYEKFLPLFRGPSRVADVLGLPDDLEAVPAPLLREAIGAELFPPHIDDALLVEFVLAVTRIAYRGAKPPGIPARVKRAVESRPPTAVYLASTAEQADFLSTRLWPYLRVADDQVAELVDVVGCRRFEDSFAFSVLLEGQQQSERVVDVFTGLRQTHVAEKVLNATVAKALRVAKRVTTEEGVEDRSVDWHLDGVDLVVRSDVDDRRVLGMVNDAFDLRLTNADLEGVLKTGLDHRLEVRRQEAKAAASDAERIELYFGPDDLRDALPKGLWQALESQGYVDSGTSVAELVLTVYGRDTIRQLGHLFQKEGFSDFPAQWAGGAATISWLRRMGFGIEYAGRRTERQDEEFVVPGAVRLSPLHTFQQKISRQLRDVLTLREQNGRHLKTMVELPTGAGKTRVATETVLKLFIDGELRGPVLWIAQSLELCEQAVQTCSTVWRGLADERPLTIGRLWDTNNVHEPDTAFSFIVATDAKLEAVLGRPEYEWLSRPSAVFVDEGHRAGGSERYTRILTWLGVAGRGWERPLVGLSATPFKGTSETATAALAARFGNRKLDAFEGDAYEQLADLGVLARVEHQVLSGVDIELSADELAEAKNQRRISQTVLDRLGRDQARMAILVDHVMSLDRSWPVLVFTPNVLSAQVLAAILRHRGVEAASVSGQTGRQERRDVIDRFKGGEIQVLANCDLLIQGFDAPGVRALYMGGPAAQLGRCAGRLGTVARRRAERSLRRRACAVPGGSRPLDPARPGGTDERPGAGVRGGRPAGVGCAACRSFVLVTRVDGLTAEAVEGLVVISSRRR